MGYTSDMSWDFTIKPKCIKQFQRLIKNADHIMLNKEKDAKLAYMLPGGLTIHNDGIWEDDSDWNGKWYYDFDFACFIAPFVVGNITFQGEDGDRWGWSIDKHGKVHEIRYMETIIKEVSTTKNQSIKLAVKLSKMTDKEFDEYMMLVEMNKVV